MSPVPLTWIQRNSRCPGAEEDQDTFFSFSFKMSLSSENASCLRTGSSAGLFIFKLADFELEAILRCKGKTYVERIFGVNFV